MEQHRHTAPDSTDNNKNILDIMQNLTRNTIYCTKNTNFSCVSKHMIYLYLLTKNIQATLISSHFKQLYRQCYPGHQFSTVYIQSKTTPEDDIVVPKHTGVREFIYTGYLFYLTTTSCHLPLAQLSH
jgi:hypothetical protein